MRKIDQPHENAAEEPAGGLRQDAGGNARRIELAMLASAIVTAGFKCAPFSAFTTQTAIVTPHPQPAMMTIQPPFCAFERESSTLTPPPNRTSSIVPRNSARRDSSLPGHSLHGLRPWHQAVERPCATHHDRAVQPAVDGVNPATASNNTNGRHGLVHPVPAETNQAVVLLATGRPRAARSGSTDLAPQGLSATPVAGRQCSRRKPLLNP